MAIRRKMFEKSTCFPWQHAKFLLEKQNYDHMIMFKHRNMTMAVIFITLDERTYDITNDDNPYGIT